MRGPLSRLHDSMIANSVGDRYSDWLKPSQGGCGAGKASRGENHGDIENGENTERARKREPLSLYPECYSARSLISAHHLSILGTLIETEFINSVCRCTSDKTERAEFGTVVTPVR